MGIRLETGISGKALMKAVQLWRNLSNPYKRRLTGLKAHTHTHTHARQHTESSTRYLAPILFSLDALQHHGFMLCGYIQNINWQTTQRRVFVNLNNPKLCHGINSFHINQRQHIINKLQHISCFAALLNLIVYGNTHSNGHQLLHLRWSIYTCLSQLKGLCMCVCACVKARGKLLQFCLKWCIHWNACMNEISRKTW